MGTELRGAGMTPALHIWLTAETEPALNKLAATWGLTRSQVIARLVKEATTK